MAGTIGLYRRRGAVTALAVSCSVLLLVGTVVSQVNFDSVVQAASASSPILRDYIGREQQSAEGRDTLLREVIGLAVQGGVVGIGPAAVKPALIDQHAPIEFEAHSDYTASLAERGVLGVLGLLALIVAVAWYARGALRPMGAGYAAVIKRPGALVGCVVTFAVGAGIYEVIHFRHLWALFGVIAALHFAGRRATTCTCVARRAARQRRAQPGAEQPRRARRRALSRSASRRCSWPASADRSGWVRWRCCACSRPSPVSSGLGPSPRRRRTFSPRAGATSRICAPRWSG